jgi:hypothetical protein
MTEDQKKQLDEIRESISSGNYKIIYDETNNTPEDIENGVVNITVMYYKSLDRITIDWCVKENAPGGKND